MRGRLIFPVLAEFARLDPAAMSFDPDFREPILVATSGDPAVDRGRRERAPVRVPVQVEPEQWDALHMAGAGDDPQSTVRVVAHVDDLVRLGVWDAANARPDVVPGDRLTGFYDAGGTRLLGAELFVDEVRPLFGFGRGAPTLVLVLLRSRRTASPRDTYG